MYHCQRVCSDILIQILEAWRVADDKVFKAVENKNLAVVPFDRLVGLTAGNDERIR